MARVLPSTEGGYKVTAPGQADANGMPVGAIIAVMTNLANSFSPAASGVAKEGWQVCDGAAVAAGQKMTGVSTPNLSDNRFLQGSATAGSTGGSNVLIDHVHSSASLATNTSTVVAHADHGHEKGSLRANIQVNTNGTIYFDPDSNNFTANYHNNSTPGRSTFHDSGQSDSTTISGSTAANTSDTSLNNIPVDGNVGSGSVASSTNSRPQYLSVVYLMKVS